MNPVHYLIGQQQLSHLHQVLTGEHKAHIVLDAWHQPEKHMAFITTASKSINKSKGCILVIHILSW